MKKIHLALSLVFMASTAFAQNIKNLSPKWEQGKTYEYDYHKTEQVLMGKENQAFKPTESYGTLKMSCRPKGEQQYYMILEFKNDMFPEYMDWCRGNKKNIKPFEQITLEFLYNLDTRKYTLINTEQIREQFSSKPGGFLYFAQSDIQVYQQYFADKQEFIRVVNDDNEDVSVLFSEQAEPFFMLIDRELAMNKTKKMEDFVESPVNPTKTESQSTSWKVKSLNTKENTVDLTVSSEQFNDEINAVFTEKVKSYGWKEKVNFKVEEHYAIDLDNTLPQSIKKTHELVGASSKKVVFRKTIELKLKVEKLEDQ